MTSLAVPFVVGAVTRRTPSLTAVFTGFGVSSFGSASVSISPPLPAGMLLTLLSESQFQRADLLAESAFVDDKISLCSSPAALRLDAGRSFAEAPLYHGRYGLYVVNCLRAGEIAGSEAALRGFSGTASLSSEGNALPSQDRPLLVVCGLELVVLLALAAWCLWRARGRTRFHAVVLAAVALRAAETLVRLVALSVVSDRGGREPLAVTRTAAVLECLATASLFTVFFLAGFGWKISPRPLHPGNLRLTAVCIAAYLASLLAWAPLCSDSVTSVKLRHNTVYCSSTAFVQVVVRLGLTFSVLGTLKPTILYVRVWASERESDPSTWTVTARFIRSATRIRVIFLTFVFFPALLLFLDAVLIQWEQTWVLSALSSIAHTTFLTLMAKI